MVKKRSVILKTSVNFRKYILLVFLCLLPLSGGCGRDERLDVYKSGMEQFYADIIAYDEVINSIDVESETSVQELLEALDNLEACFTQMAALSVPKEFSVIESLAAEAGEYMSQAVALYHLAYESTPFDTAAAQAAKEYYDRANKRAVYMLSILHGEIPEGLDM